MAYSAKIETNWFGIRVDSRDIGVSYHELADAEGAASALAAHGYNRIEIIDRPSGRVVMHVSPSPAAA